MKLFLTTFAILIVITFADITPQTLFVPANSTLELKNTGMCSEITIDVIPIYNSTHINSLYHVNIILDGYIDGTYMKSCYSNDTNTCKLSLTTWTTKNSFTYYFSTNNDVYISYRLSSNLGLPVFFYTSITVIGIIIAYFIIAILIISIVIIFNSLIKSKMKTNEDEGSEPIEVTIQDEDNI